jgi:hypothetical protein
MSGGEKKVAGKVRPQSLRKMGDILLDHETILQEMIEHGLQWGDILNLTRGYLEVHSPGSQEEYVEGGHPEFYYGPKKENHD